MIALFRSPLVGTRLFGTVGHASLIALCLAVFALQLLLSHLWLSSFRYGPIEWIWRRMTYGRWEEHTTPAGYASGDLAKGGK